MAVKVTAPKGLLPKTAAVGGDFIVRPIGMSFATQDADEEIYMLLRRAMVTNFGWIFSTALYAIAPLILAVLLNNFNMDLSSKIPVSFFYVLPLVYYSFLITYALIKFNSWFYNVIIITNKRLLVYSFLPLSTYHVSEANLEHIQDVSQSTIGVFPSLFNYGDLLIETAGSRAKFRAKNIPRPTWVRNILVDLSNLTRE